MSHIARGRTQFTDLDTLQQAAESLGLVFEKASQCRYYRHQMQACDYRIRRRDNQGYHLGFTVNQDGSIDTLWDDYEQYECREGERLAELTGQPEVGGTDHRKLKSAYAEIAAIKTAQQKGLTITREVGEDGRIVLRATHTGTIQGGDGGTIGGADFGTCNW
jgi:hypothetical protein